MSRYAATSENTTRCFRSRRQDGCSATDPRTAGATAVRTSHLRLRARQILLRPGSGASVAVATGSLQSHLKGRLRARQPKLKPNQAKHQLELHDLGTYTQAELAELFGNGRSTIHRTLEYVRPAPP